MNDNSNFILATVTKAITFGGFLSDITGGLQVI